MVYVKQVTALLPMAPTSVNVSVQKKVRKDKEQIDNRG